MPHEGWRLGAGGIHDEAGGPCDDAGGVDAAPEPVAPVTPVEFVRLVLLVMRDEVVRDQHAEERHEDAADEKQEVLVPEEIDAHGERERSRADNDREHAMRHSHEILQRDGARVNVRECVIGLVNENDEEKQPADGERKQ